MGRGATRSLERVAAAMGDLKSAPIRFEPAKDVPHGGVLLALPALLAQGLLRHTAVFYSLPDGFYGIESIFLLLALMALARLSSIEKMRYTSPGEWGNLLGLDRVPEVRTLRAKLDLLCHQAGRAVSWNAALAKEWIAGQQDSELVFYADGHVRVYHGDLTALPRHYVSRERLCLRATTDYWINAMDGQPFFYVNKEVDPGLIATLRQDLVPFLENNAPISIELQKRMDANVLYHRFTLVFDREGYSPELFSEMKAQRIAVLTYHKHPGDDWPVQEFSERTVKLNSGEEVTMKLAERGTQMSNRLWVREVRKLGESGKQTAMLSTNYVADYTMLAVSMFARWSQENFFKYMREHYGLDRLVEYGTEPVPAAVCLVNPAWRKLDGQVRTLSGKRQRSLAKFAELGLENTLSETEVTGYENKKAQLQEEVDHLGNQLRDLKQKRKETAKHVKIGELPEAERFSRLLTERKHFLDTIKMISYRAESSMASILRSSMGRTNDTRSLLRQVYCTEADLLPDDATKILTIRLHPLAQNAHDKSIRNLCEELNATETIFPGTDLRLRYEIGSS